MLQVHGDVFRPPQAGSWLATYVGTGVQILGMLLVTITFALLGFLSPANRGGLMTAAVMMFVFMGLVGGYAAARLYKAFRGDKWKKMTTRTAFMFPGEGLVGWLPGLEGDGEAVGGLPAGQQEGEGVAPECTHLASSTPCRSAPLCSCQYSSILLITVPL